jgi:group I intron endonuclease
MIIYEIKNKINSKSYIGQHSSNDLGSYWGSGKLIKRAIEKYGIENFERIILEKCSDKNELNEREKYWIKEKDSINTGYNLTEGGTGGDNSKFIEYSEEWKEGQRNKTKEYWDSLSEEERKERSLKVSGENNGMFNKVGHWKDKNIPKETIQKGLESRRSYKGEENPNWKGGITKKQCKCGKDISPNNETCSVCRNRNSENNPFFGKHHSEETKKKLSESRKGKKPTNIKSVIIDSFTYESLAEASRQTGITATTILWRVNSKNKKYENYQSHPAIKAELSN